ncbi:hypothetical protein [Pseudolactococcus raffinolactis]|uniref:hypothetical protein n=1 Tax=Pseudolactococcus raffinolactis TaxID=1366 RepID=UPI002416C66B|nr:hypothetical protein [Lactococcus raffinolactis]MDG4961513.1 hypothetical protein [Lactococcus raffinolactis]
MAKKRMFSADIVRSDMFLDLPPTSQLLYFHFGMIADDDGIVASVRRELNYLGFGSTDDLKLLSDKKMIDFTSDGKIVFIIDWTANNTLRKERYSESIHKSAKKEMFEKGYKFRYTTGLSFGAPDVTQGVTQPTPPDIGLDIDKDKDIDKELVSGINQSTLDQIESISESEALRNIELNKKFKVYSDTYPKKTKKIEAREFFNRLSDDEIEKVIIGAQNVLKLSKTMSSEEYKYLKNQATFISDSEYLDYQASRNDKPQTPVGSRVPEWAKEEKKKVVREW